MTVCLCVCAAWRLTGEVCACTVGSKVSSVCVGCVTLKQTLVLGLHFGDVEHSRVAAQPLHVDLFAIHPLGIDGVGIVWLSCAYYADFPVWCWCQVHGPLKVLLHALFVAGHVAPDGHVGALGPYQRSTLHCYHPLSHGNTGCKWTWENRERKREERKIAWVKKKNCCLNTATVWHARMSILESAHWGWGITQRAHARLLNTTNVFKHSHSHSLTTIIQSLLAAVTHTHTLLC